MLQPLLNKFILRHFPLLEPHQFSQKWFLCNEPCPELDKVALQVSALVLAIMTLLRLQVQPLQQCHLVDLPQTQWQDRKEFLRQAVCQIWNG
jgi:hypothetical protein